MTSITLDDVKNHPTWTSINGKVYDLHVFLHNDLHPGGSQILRLALGRDATELFQSYHPSTGMLLVRRMLSTLPVKGVLSQDQDQDQPTRPPIQGGDFFTVLRSRVDKELDYQGYHRHSYQVVYLLETVVTLALHLFTSVQCVLEDHWIWPVACGLTIARLGFIMHTGNHCGASCFPTLNHFMGKIMSYIGGNQLIWKHEHQIAHHLTPNTVGKDNDCEIGYPFVRLHPGLPWKKWNSYQQITLLVGITFGLLKWSLSDPFMFISRRIGNITLHKIQDSDWRELVVSKVWWWGIHFVAPCVAWGLGEGVWSGIIKFAIASWYLENIFIVNHIQEPLMTIKDECTHKDHWSVQQVKGTSNWSAGSGWWNWFSGGLNHQIEHHLFPSIHPYLYPKISGVVKRTCKEFGLPYYTYSSFGSAWLDMFRFVGRLGRKRI